MQDILTDLQSQEISPYCRKDSALICHPHGALVIFHNWGDSEDLLPSIKISVYMGMAIKEEHLPLFFYTRKILITEDFGFSQKLDRASI